MRGRLRVLGVIGARCLRHVVFGLRLRLLALPFQLGLMSEVLFFRAADGAEQSVDEGCRTFVAQRLGETDRLVDGDFVRHFVVVQDLPGGDAQNVAIDNGHTLDFPAGGMFIEQMINLSTVLSDAADNFNRIVGKR